MKQIYLVVLFIGAVHVQGFSQTFKEFSTPEQFLVELEAQIVDKSVGDAKKTHKDLIEHFSEMWTELNSFTPGQKSVIFQTSNALLKNRLKMIPDVRDYIKTTITIVEAYPDHHVWK